MSIQFRRGTAAQAAMNNPLLAAGEPGYTTDDYRFKVGDGIRLWNDLPYLVDNAFVGFVPPGGDPGQVLKKVDGDDFNFAWGPPTVGGGASSPGLPDGWVSLYDFDAAGDGVTDDTNAIISAFDAAISYGARIWAPPGIFKFSQLDLQRYAGCWQLEGVGAYQWTGNFGNTSCQPKTIFRCSATDDQDGIIAFQTQGGKIKGIQFEYEEGYEGILLNIGSNPDNNSGVGTNTFKVSECRFISDHTGSYSTAKAMIGMNNTVMIVVEDCSLMGAQALIRGLRDSGVDSFANCVMINRCQFETATVGQIVNPYENWHISNSLFEFTNPLTVAGITSDSSSMFGGSYTDIVLSNCWWWDLVAPTEQVPILQPAGVDWRITIDKNWFHDPTTAPIQLLGPGSAIVTHNRVLSGIPTPMETFIDLGDHTTAQKRIVRIEGNECAVNGSQNLAVINYAGHLNKSIRNNTFSGPYTTTAGVWTPAPSSIHLTDDNDTQLFFGGTAIADEAAAAGKTWEFYTLPANGVICVVTFPSGSRINLNGATDITHTTFTLNNGWAKIAKVDAGKVWNIAAIANPSGGAVLS